MKLLEKLKNTVTRFTTSSKPFGITICTTNECDYNLGYRYQNRTEKKIDVRFDTLENAIAWAETQNPGNGYEKIDIWNDILEKDYYGHIGFSKGEPIFARNNRCIGRKYTYIWYEIQREEVK